MELPINQFKKGLREGRPQIGLWTALADAYCAEICAGAGFDWLCLDAEHSPNDLRSLLAQLQAIAAYPTQAMVRVPIGDTVLIKQVLDLGVQTLLAPLVESAEQAAAIVRATRYPRAGVRGVGSALARASRWNRIDDYLRRADSEMCVLAQVETLAGLENVDAIARVDGVDGVFIGPADLAAALGYLGAPSHPQVKSAIEDAIGCIRATGKAAGILSADETFARHCLSLGCTFVGVGADATLLARATQSLAERFKAPQNTAPRDSGGSVY